MIARTGTSYIKQMPLRVIGLFQISIVGCCLNPFLQGDYLIIAGHHDNGTELQAFGKMHRADRYVIAGRFNLFVEYLEAEPYRLYRRPPPVKFSSRAYENTYLVRHHVRAYAISRPLADSFDFFFLGIANHNDRFRPIEYRYYAAPVFCIS